MIIKRAKQVLQIEAKAIEQLMTRINEQFVQAVELILACEGKVVVTGVGKSGIIGQKIAATLASTGTPAFFLHSSEGIHGDLGMLEKKDIVIAISNSGETDELSQILPLIKRYGNKLIALTGKDNSTLARAGDVVLDVSVEEEACPLGLAPPPVRLRPWPWGTPWPSPCSRSAGLRKRTSPSGIPAGSSASDSCSGYAT
jgi:arabinose-5-phosphate isomerase